MASNQGRDSGARNWVFTLNNWTEEEYYNIVDCEDFNYLLIGKEMSRRGTPHLQGYIEFRMKKRLATIRKIPGFKKAALFKSRGTAKEASDYIKNNPDKPVPDFDEWGAMHEQGKVKVDIVKAAQQTAQGVSTTDLVEEHGAGYIMNRKRIRETAHDMEQESNKKRLKLEMEVVVLKLCQKEVVSRLRVQDKRTILFVVDPVGGAEKTYLSLWIMVMLDGERLCNGRSADIKHLYKGGKYVSFDYCRSQTEHINYEVLEDIKNGYFCSTKYDSCQKLWGPTKVVVFMNSPPDMSKMSVDRFEIMNVNPSMS